MSFAIAWGAARDAERSHIVRDCFAKVCGLWAIIGRDVDSERSRDSTLQMPLPVLPWVETLEGLKTQDSKHYHLEFSFFSQLFEVPGVEKTTDWTGNVTSNCWRLLTLGVVECDRAHCWARKHRDKVVKTWRRFCGSLAVECCTGALEFSPNVLWKLL